MKKTSVLQLLAAFVLLLCTTACGKYQYESVKGDPTNTRIYTLDNGLKVYLSVNKEAPRIQTFIAVRTGSKNDPAETTGLAHYLEHLMFKGTDKFGVIDAAKEAPFLADIEARYEKYRKMTDPEERRQAYHEIDSVSQLAAKYFIPNEYDKLMSTIGAIGTNAFTDVDVTCYEEDIPSNEVENWAKIQSDRFQNMVIRGFHTELEAVYEEYNMSLTADVRKIIEAMDALLYPGDPYGTQTTIGTQEHLKNPSITNIKNYFNKWYRPNNVAICMTGDFDPDEVMTIIDKYFGQWQPGDDVEQPTMPTPKPITAPLDTTVVGLEAETLWMGYRFDGASAMQIDTLQVVSKMLFNGTAGLLDLDHNSKMKTMGSWCDIMASMDHSKLIVVATPNEGQSLDEVRGLLLEEVNKLKAGNFSDDLLPSVVNNMKLDYFKELENNYSRNYLIMRSFINGSPWKQEVGRLDRLSGITKDQIVAFARKYLTDNYVAVYKRQGVDPNQKKIDKPQITPINANRDSVSQFVKDIQEAKVEPIKPQFVNFSSDLVKGNTSVGVPYVYVKNNENGRFEMAFHYDFGDSADPRYSFATQYLDLLGTDSLSAEQIKQQFYKLACQYDVDVLNRSIDVNLSGLSENMSEALALVEHIFAHAKVDKEAYAQYCQQVFKARQDNKADQIACFTRLYFYALNGADNPFTRTLSNEQLAKTDPQALVDLMKSLSQYEHTILYYGPMDESELNDVVTLRHKVPAKMKAALVNTDFTNQTTPANEVFIAPYDAKNIYMRMLHNEGKAWDESNLAVKAVFNEYFGGGMNTVVFQEMREARGLAYNAYAQYVEPGLKGKSEFFLTHIITQNDKMMDCINHFNLIIDSIPQSQKSFDIAKEALTKRLASTRVTKFGLINKWIAARNLGIDYDTNERVYNDLPNITLKQMISFEQQNMARKPMRYVILGNEKDLDMASLGKIGPVKRVSLNEIFGY